MKFDRCLYIILFLLPFSVLSQNPKGLQAIESVDFYSPLLKKQTLSQFLIHSLPNASLGLGYYEGLYAGSGDLSTDYVEVKSKNGKVVVQHTFFDGNDLHTVDLRFISYSDGVLICDKATLYFVKSKGKIESQLGRKYLSGIILHYTKNFYPYCRYDKESSGLIRVDRRSSSSFYVSGKIYKLTME
ncbi:MAG: hypothetical protein ACKO6Q_06605 [Bacteroidota bacterium]